MAFSSESFRRNRATALVMDLQASLADEAKLDARRDGRVRAIATYADAVNDWLVTHVPGARRALLLLAGIVDALRAERAIDALVDSENAKQLRLARELAGLLDGVDLEDRMPMAVSA